jgi:hypothetical protein
MLGAAISDSNARSGNELDVAFYTIKAVQRAGIRGANTDCG